MANLIRVVGRGYLTGITAFIRVFERINRGTYILGSVVLAPLVLLISANIITRAFGVVIPGTYSLVVLIAIFVTCPAIISAQIAKRHITIDFVANRLGSRAKIVNEWIGGILTIFIWGAAAWASLNNAWQMWFRNELQDPLDIPVAPFRFILGITLILICCATLINLLKLLIPTPKNASERR